MVELDPDNVASRIKLAEVYAKQNMLEEARSKSSLKRLPRISRLHIASTITSRSR